VSITVPVERVPPITLVGLIVNDASAGGAGFMVRTALLVPPYVPVIVADVDVETTLVVTANVAVVAPAVIVILPGTCADVLLLDNVTTTPAAGAIPFRVTVPVEGLPP
jgi:hypothetical protein